MSWFMHHAVLFALLCAGAAVAYGIGLTFWLLRQPEGTERMQEISHAVQEGAAAYLRRQYRTIAIVAIVPFLALGFYHSLGWGTAVGFLDRRRPLRGSGLHRHERRRPLESSARPRRPARACRRR